MDNEPDIKAEKKRDTAKEIRQEQREQEFNQWKNDNHRELCVEFVNENCPNDFEEFCWEEFNRMKGD